jgi:hypothetical protein
VELRGRRSKSVLRSDGHWRAPYKRIKCAKHVVLASAAAQALEFLLIP